MGKWTLRPFTVAHLCPHPFHLILFSQMTLSQYLRFTEETNAIDYLEKTITFIKTVNEKPLDWKWVILASHGALYNFMICTLKGTNPDNVCTTTKAGKKRLIGFLEALKRCQDPQCMNSSGFTNVLQLSKEQREAVDDIHSKFRNQFEHYQPKMWSIQPDGMPQIVMHTLDVLQFVGQDMGCYYAHFEAGDHQKISDLIIEGKAIVAHLIGEAEAL